jgi:poly(3-hydroxybutyrate) depolymerase
MAAAGAAASPIGAAGTPLEFHLPHDGRDRSYLIYAPPRTPTDTGKRPPARPARRQRRPTGWCGSRRTAGFDALADRDRFVVVPMAWIVLERWRTVRLDGTAGIGDVGSSARW